MAKITVKPGVRFRSIIADHNALWEVIQKEGPNSWLCEVVNEKIEISPGVKIDGEHAGTVKAFLTSEIEGRVQFAEGFKKLMSDHDKFYASLKPGQVVHYDHGFGEQYVRCVVTDQQFQDRPGHSLRPVALVGKWHQTEMPNYLINVNGMVKT